MSNIDLKESLYEKSTIDLNFGLVDNEERSRFFNMNNYMILNSNFQNFHFLLNNNNKSNDSIQKESKKKLMEDSFENDLKLIKDKYRKNFYDNKAKYVFSTCFDNNIIHENVLKNYYKNKNKNISDISEMQIEFTKSNILDSSLNSSNQIQNYYSEKKNESLSIEDSALRTSSIKNFMHTGGVYEINFNEKKEDNNIIKNSRKNIINLNEVKDFDKNKLSNDLIKNTNIKGVYNDLEFSKGVNLKPENFLNNIITSESVLIKDDFEINSNYIITNFEEKTEINENNNKENLLKNENQTKNSLSFKVSRKSSGENEIKKENMVNRTSPKQTHLNPNNHKNDNIEINIKRKNSYKTIDHDECNSKNSSNKKYVKQKSLERNQSTKNLLIDSKHLRRLSKDYDFENLELNVFMENENSNKLFNKETENNYYNIQTKKSQKKNNDLYYKPQKLKINLYSHKNKYKKNEKLNRNISGSPNNRLSNLNNDDFTGKNNYNYKYYHESKLYKDKKERNGKLVSNRNRFYEKDKIDHKDSRNNIISKNPFKLAPEFNSNSKKKGLGLNRVQSVQDLHAEKMKINQSLDDFKEKNGAKYNAKYIVKAKSNQKIEKINSINRRSESNKFIENKFKNENKKTSLANESSNNLGSYTKSYRTILNNNSHSNKRGNLIF